MKKTIFWNDYTHNVRAVLGAFVLAAAGLGALACEGVADPPASKPPEVPSEENPPKVTNLTGSRGGDAEEIITLAWTDPIPANSFDSIEITFKPEDTAVPQPISVDKGEKGKEITGLKIIQDYTFYVKTVKGEKKSDSVSKTVKGVTVNIDTAIAAAMTAALADGSGTVDDPCKFKLESADLSMEINIGKVMTALYNSDKAYFSLDLSNNNTALTWPRTVLQGQEKVVGLVLPDGVSSFLDVLAGQTVFSAYANLRSISASGVVTIGASAFKEHPALTSATFPKATEIKSNAFEKCKKLTTVAFAKVTTVGPSAFSGCAALTTATFDVVTDIQASAFSDCVALATVSFPELLYIGNNAFFQCYGLTTFTAANVKTIGNHAFNTCYSLAAANFPACTGAGDYAFAWCQGLNENTVDFTALETAGEHAFSGCGHGDAPITQVAAGYASKIVTLVAANPTANPPVEAVTVEVSPPRFTTTDRGSGANRYVFPELKVVGKSTFRNLYTLVTARFPKATEMMVYAFDNCVNLVEVDMPLCKNISPKGLYHCNNLVSAKFPALERIEFNALLWCEKLDLTQSQFGTLESDGTGTLKMLGSNFLANTVGFPGSTATHPRRPSTPDELAALALAEGEADPGQLLTPLAAEQLPNLDIFSSVEVIQTGTFIGLSWLTDVSLPNVEYTDFNNETFVVNETAGGNNLFYGCTALETVDMPKVKHIGNYAFMNNAALETVDMPELLTIGQHAFRGCASLETVSAPLVTAVGNYAFTGCTSLQEITLASAISLGTNVFSSSNALSAGTGGSPTAPPATLACAALTTVDMPVLETIGNSAFLGSGLTAAAFPAVISVGTYVFDQCAALGTVDMPALVTIGEGAFQRTALVDVEFPEAVTAGAYAFRGCVVLETVTMPKLTTLGLKAFSNNGNPTGFTDANRCLVLREVDMPRLATIGESAWNGCPELATAKTAMTEAQVKYQFALNPKLTSLYVGATPPSTSAISVFYNGTAEGNTLPVGVRQAGNLTIYVPAVAGDTNATNERKAAWKSWVDATVTNVNQNGKVEYSTYTPPADPVPGV